ncbi:MAG: tetratricopeptide repeat protein [Pseudomonadota bacterium]|nr:tetratricopeptide repeat protein [Pseudomonadota bacterium]
MIRILCMSVVVTALAAATPAQAQSRRELAERIDATEVRIGELDNQFLAGDPVVETLLQRLDALDYQIQELTSANEQMRFENRQLRETVEMLQAEVEGMRAPAINDATASWMTDGLEADGGEADVTVTQVENPDLAHSNPDDPFADARAAATGTLGGAPDAAAPSISPEELFASGRSRLVDNDFGGAQMAFETFVTDNPDHPNVGEAWYWLGQTFYVQDNFGDAADAYIASLRSQPSGQRAPDALVQLAASLRGLGRVDEACGTLSQFGRQFPNAPAEARDRAARESVRANCR